VTPLERTIEFLKVNGYRSVQQPIGVRSASFMFDAVLTTDKSLDLVILQDTTVGSGERLRRELLAFGRSLDVLGSRRTLTLVLVGQPLEAVTLEALAQICRILSVRLLKDDESRLRDSLAILLPLELPDPTVMQGDWASEVRRRLSPDRMRAASGYLNAAEQGEASVRQELRRRVERALAGVLS
jgi:hypothetical protein